MTPLLVICGPTASGKTALAIELCRRLNGEIISADSMQIYRGCDIVTAKPSAAELAAARHHLIDIRNPDERYSAGEWARDAALLIDDCRQRGVVPIVCGGTGFYIRALLEPESLVTQEADPQLRASLEAELTEFGADFMHARLTEVNPSAAAKIHPNDHYRVLRALEIALHPSGVNKPAAERPFRAVAFAFEWQREVLYQRIERRVDEMLDTGALEETAHIREQWGAEAPALGGVGYKQLLPALDDASSLGQCVAVWKQDTRRYAKRQLTWFRHQLEVEWLKPEVGLAESASVVERQWKTINR